MGFLSNINETHYSIAYIIVTAITIVLATVYGITIAEVIAGILVKSAIYIVSSTVLLKALMGQKVNILKEILEENNIALAIVVAGILLGLGCSISGF